jgi:hypothetical protein
LNHSQPTNVTLVEDDKHMVISIHDSDLDESANIMAPPSATDELDMDDEEISISVTGSEKSLKKRATEATNKTMAETS